MRGPTRRSLFWLCSGVAVLGCAQIGGVDGEYQERAHGGAAASGGVSLPIGAVGTGGAGSGGVATAGGAGAGATGGVAGAGAGAGAGTTGAGAGAGAPMCGLTTTASPDCTSCMLSNCCAEANYCSADGVCATCAIPAVDLNCYANLSFVYLTACLDTSCSSVCAPTTSAQCNTIQSLDACAHCCDANHAKGVTTYMTDFANCACLPAGNCTMLCGETSLCNTGDPQPTTPCVECYNTCPQPNCNADADCTALLSCRAGCP